jgi:hypothetical protein
VRGLRAAQAGVDVSPVSDARAARRIAANCLKKQPFMARLLVGVSQKFF